MRHLFSAALLAAFAFEVSSASAQTAESYVVFSNKSGAATGWRDETSKGLYRAFATHGFKVRSIGLGDAGKGMTAIVDSECGSLAEPIKSIQINLDLTFDSCLPIKPGQD